MSRSAIESGRIAHGSDHRPGSSARRRRARRWGGSLFQRALALATLSMLAPAAQAYLDPGTGVLIVQVAIGAIAGALVAVKPYWSKIKAGWCRLTGRRDPREPGDPSRSEDDVQ